MTDTDLRVQFESQWLDIRDIVLSEAGRQLSSGGRVDAGALTARLRGETSKWRQGVLARGLWFRAFSETAPDGAAIFDGRVLRQSLHRPAGIKKPSDFPAYALFLALSVLFGCVLHAFTEFGAVRQVFYPVLLFVLMRTLYVPVKNGRRDTFERRVLEDIGGQLDVMGSELEECVGRGSEGTESTPSGPENPGKNGAS